MHFVLCLSLACVCVCVCLFLSSLNMCFGLHSDESFSIQFTVNPIRSSRFCRNMCGLRFTYIKSFGIFVRARLNWQWSPRYAKTVVVANSHKPAVNRYKAMAAVRRCVSASNASKIFKYGDPRTSYIGGGHMRRTGARIKWEQQAKCMWVVCNNDIYDGYQAVSVQVFNLSFESHI